MRRNRLGKSAGISMLELIVVIIILGIIAAIAFPRFSDTQDNTNRDTEITEVRQAIYDLKSYYVGHKQWDTNISKMTPIALEYGSGAEGKNAIYWYKVGQEWCVEFQLNPNDQPGEFAVNVVPGGGCDLVYNTLQNLDIAGTTTDPKIYTMGTLDSSH
jgi:type II secretory pathway pseudopilin PulG